MGLILAPVHTALSPWLAASPKEMVRQGKNKGHSALTGDRIENPWIVPEKLLQAH
jgi:hypothetical protein